MSQPGPGGSGQLALDFGHRPAFGREDFLIASCNAEAVAWIDRWPDWPGPALALYGPPGCGKSHLAQVWRARAGASEISPSTLRSESVAERLGAARAVFIENAGEGIEERALLHLYNMLAERGGHLLLTGREPPARWHMALADLRSRLAAASAIAMAAPDEGLMAALLVKLFADRQLRVSTELVAYLVARMERSFAAARAIVAALDAASLAGRRPITIPLARALIESLPPEPG
jgi:chromosomal replication initiation ATPase DnaA